MTLISRTKETEDFFWNEKRARTQLIHLSKVIQASCIFKSTLRFCIISDLWYNTGCIQLKLFNTARLKTELRMSNKNKRCLVMQDAKMKNKDEGRIEKSINQSQPYENHLHSIFQATFQTKRKQIKDREKQRCKLKYWKWN